MTRVNHVGAENGVTQLKTDLRINDYVVPENYVPRVLADPSLKTLSKKLCYALRWGAKELGLYMSEQGYVNLEDIMCCKFFRNATEEKLEQICNTDEDDSP